MHSLKTLLALATIASTTLSPAPATASLLLPRNPTQSPSCSGCGTGLSQSDYQNLIDQIDTATTYTVPFDSKSAHFTGVAVNADGSPAVSCTLEDKDGDGTKDAGTISGALLASMLSELNGKVTDLQPSCVALDGTYFYSFGTGGNCAGEGGP